MLKRVAQRRKHVQDQQLGTLYDIVLVTSHNCRKKVHTRYAWSGRFAQYYEAQYYASGLKTIKSDLFWNHFAGVILCTQSSPDYDFRFQPCQPQAEGKINPSLNDVHDGAMILSYVSSYS